MKKVEKDAILRWRLTSKEIANATGLNGKTETHVEKVKRLKKVKKAYNAFVSYYFPHYYKAVCADFHIEAAEKILADKNIFAILEWAREHAKSVHADILIPLWLLIHGELEGMILIGKSEGDACKLLGDLQAELQYNQRFIADYGEQFSFGSWEEGDFTTQGGINFTALGRGQSPRGVRNAEKRPNYCVVDDIDDDEIVYNQSRVSKVVDWLLSAVYGALAIKGARFVMVGNRIHKQSILAHIVGDLNEGDPKRENIYHSKIYAIDPKTKQPSWWQNFTLEQLSLKFQRMGYRLSQREYFHNPISEGKVFKKDWIHYKPMRLTKGEYEHIIVYTDPSFKESKKSDFKATVVVGKKGKEFHIIRAFVRQCSVGEMVRWQYELYDWLEARFKGGTTYDFYMEANFIQDILLDDFKAEGELRNYQLPLIGDKRDKPNKAARIESASVFWERGEVFYNEDMKADRDMQTCIEQTLAFEPGSGVHDDAPDACEGAIWLLQRRARNSAFTRIIGKRVERGF